MMSASGKSTQHLLDEVQGLAPLDGFAVDHFLGQLADELAADDAATLAGLEARDGRLRAALAAIDAFASKSMRIRLDHVLAADTSVAGRFRTYLATTIIDYDGDLGLLRQRVAAAAARVDPRGAADLAATVADAAGQVLAVRAELRRGVLALARDLAAASVVAAQHAARDHGRDDAERLRWSAARRDLERVVERPEHLAEHDWAARLRALPRVDETPEEAPALTRGELLELD